MTRDPNENEAIREETDYLHFSPDDPRVGPFYFDSFDEALEFVNRRDWHFESEDWEPAGLFEERIVCKGQDGVLWGELARCTIKFWDL